MRRIAPRVLLCMLLLGAGISGHSGEAAPAARLAFFAGMQGGYAFASANGGVSWQERDSGLPGGADITALAAAPGASGIVYAGTAGSGVYVSRDQGATWSADGSLPYQGGLNVRAIAVDQRSSRTVYAGVDSGAIFKSNDGGGWQSLPISTGSAITSLAIAADSSETIVAGTRDDGLLISRDGGASWQAPDQNAPTGAQINALAVDPRDAAVIYAATSDGMYQSIDAGASWQPERRGSPPAPMCWPWRWTRATAHMCLPATRTACSIARATAGRVGRRRLGAPIHRSMLSPSIPRGPAWRSWPWRAAG